MPGRGNAGGKSRGQADGKGRGQADDAWAHGSAGKNDGGVNEADRGGRSRSELAPGHLKQDAGDQSARDFAPGQGGTPPGEMPRNRGENAVETPEADSLTREA